MKLLAWAISALVGAIGASIGTPAQAQSAPPASGSRVNCDSYLVQWQSISGRSQAQAIFDLLERTPSTCPGTRAALNRFLDLQAAREGVAVGFNPTTGRRSLVPLPTAVAIDPPPPEPPRPAPAAPQARAPGIISARELVWLRRAGADTFARNYPPRAAQQGIGGRVLLSCQVNAAGGLMCTVTSETPPNLGFGEAALAIAGEFQLAPTTRSGAPTSGGRIYLPMVFNAAEPLPPTPAPPR